MADSTKPSTEDPKRRGGAVGGSPAVADDDDVAFGAMAGIGVLAAIVISMMALTGMFGPDVSTTVTPAVVAPAESAAAMITATDDDITLDGTVPSDDIHHELVDIATTHYGEDHVTDHLTVVDGADPFTLTATGTLSDPAMVAALGEELGGLGLGTNFDNQLSAVEVDEPAEVVPEADPAAAVIDAADDAITLSGTVPSDAVADELRAVAAASYSEDQITDTLSVVDGAEPFTLEVNGTLNSSALADTLGAGFGGVSGADEFADNLEVSAAGAGIEELNALIEAEPILFETATSVIVADSEATLDKAAAILLQFPDASIEVQGHTDSRGDDNANLALSQRRAEAVLAALQARGVTTELTAVGYGETQLKVDPDDTAEKQQANRRIEFKVL